METVFPGVYSDGRDILTKALVPGSVYGEELRGGYRVWNPHRSKLAAAIRKGLRELPLNEESRVLYLGASTGTTVSHISDIARRGEVYALEFSETSMRKLLKLAGARRNIIPLLQDARRPGDYMHLVGDVDFIYQDVAQPDQSQILIDNADAFLKSGGMAFICIKSRSIDSIRPPTEVFREQRLLLEGEFEVIQETGLDPYDRDHHVYLLKHR